MDHRKVSGKRASQKGVGIILRLLTRLILLALALLVSILLAKQGRDLKSYSAQLLALAALPLWIIVLFGRNHRRRLMAGIPFFYLWLGVLTVGSISAPMAAGHELLRQALFVSLFIATQLTLLRQEFLRLVALWLLCFLAVGTYAFLQRCGFEPVEEFRLFNSQARVFSTFGNPDFLGAHLALLLPLSAGFACGLARPLPRALGSFLVASVALILFLTGSRGAWLGAALGFGVWAAIKYPWPHLRRKFLIYFIGLGIAGGILALSGQFHYQSLTRHTDRPQLWQGALMMVRERPLIGFGLGSFPAEYPSFAPAAFSQRMRLDNTFAEHAHCEYLNLAAETGIAGLGIFLWFLIAILRRAFLMARAGGIWQAVPGAIIAALIHAAFDRNFRLASTAVPFWMLCGALFTPACFPSPASAFSGRFTRLCLVAVVSVCLAASAWALRPLQASYRVAAEPDFLGGRPPTPAALLKTQGSGRRLDPLYFMELGNAYARERNFEDAITSYREACRLAPNWHDAVNNLGNCLFMLSRFDEAVAAYRRALELNPSDNEARFNLAFAYYHQRKIKEATYECEGILKDDPHNHKALQLREQLRP